MSGGVGGWRGAIPVTRPDRGRPPHIAPQNAGYLSQADTPFPPFARWRSLALTFSKAGASGARGCRKFPGAAGAGFRCAASAAAAAPVAARSVPNVRRLPWSELILSLMLRHSSRRLLERGRRQLSRIQTIDVGGR